MDKQLGLSRITNKDVGKFCLMCYTDGFPDVCILISREEVFKLATKKVDSIDSPCQIIILKDVPTPKVPTLLRDYRLKK